MTSTTENQPKDTPVKIYYFHNCQDRHTSWPDLARCCWPHAEIVGDGPYASASCGAHNVVLHSTPEQARARKRSLDRDGCRPRCYQQHHVILLEGAQQNRRPPAPVAGRATTLAAPTTDKPICGRPRTNGQPCQRPPGWGADPGELRCKDHGGATVQRTAEKERAVDEALAYASKVETTRTSLLAAAELLETDAAGRVAGLPFCAPVSEVPGWPDPRLRLPAALGSLRAAGEERAGDAG